MTADFVEFFKVIDIALNECWSLWGTLPEADDQRKWNVSAMHSMKKMFNIVEQEGLSVKGKLPTFW